ncbi:alcohol dehydrogenase catalytic domain-containing protein [Streptomyces sp. NPDC020917]|uniref:alcohol dehydrogenase catalytic domain-containing protein n=1 Tax=Streptomyces sp. NPDC020917 TaxID=3365102 RepID=UPI0037AA3AE6
MTGETYRAWTVAGQRQFTAVERIRKEPEPGQARIRVDACGVCHSDVLAVEGLRPDPETPVVPGHEIIGTIEALGDGAGAGWRVGERVGVGYLGGQDNVCEACRRGDFVNCSDQPSTGTDVDGGYSEVVYARATGLVRLPPGLDVPRGAPLLCAGLTVYNALASAAVRPGALVAVQGIGGLGHLGLQYARAMGYRVVAVARGPQKAALARELGAQEYVDSTEAAPGDALQRFGGAALVVATAASGASMSPLVAGLAPRGQLVVVGAAPDPLQLSTSELIFGTRVVRGNLTGTAIENEDNLRFAVDRSIHPSDEVFPLDEAPRAYERMMSGEARFRVVLTMTG